MRARKWFSWLGIAVGGTLFLLQFIRGIEALQNAKGVINPTFVLVALIAILAAFVAQIAGWLILMRGLGAHLDWPDAFAGYVLSFIPRYIPGTIWGYLSRSQWMNEKHSIGYRVTNFGSLLEILVGISSAGSVALVFASFINATLERWVFLAVALLLPALAWQCICIFRRLPIIRRWMTYPIASDIRLFPSFGRWASVYLLYILLWTCYGEGLWAVSIAVGSPLVYNLLALTAIFAIAWIVGLIIPVPAGLGVRELMISGMLTSVAGLSAEQSSVLAVGLRVMSLGAELLLVVISFLLRSRMAEQP